MRGTVAEGDEFVAFRITLEGGSDPATAKITVDQFLAIDHGGSEDPSVFDEQTFLNLVGGGTLNLQLTTTVTDGDGDQVSSPVQVNLIGNETSFIAFDDDGPTVTAGEGGERPSLAVLNLDETIGQGENAALDRYSARSKSNGGPSNGGLDDTGVTTITVSTTPVQGQAIGELSTIGRCAGCSVCDRKRGFWNGWCRAGGRYQQRSDAGSFGRKRCHDSDRDRAGWHRA